MGTSDLSRRDFLRTATQTAATAAACATTPKRAVGGAVRPMRLGGPIFVKTDDPGEMARAHRALGYRAAYAPNVKLADKERIAAIVKEYAAEDVAIAEVGAWVNLLDPNPEKRRKNIEYVTEQLALAEELGARCCPDIAGTFNPDVWYGPHPDNFTPRFFDGVVENCRKVIDAVKPKRTKFAIEMMGWCPPTGPDEYVKLIKAVDRAGFGVHLDPCNILTSPQRFYTNAAIIRECFAKLGRWIVSCHAKDLAWEIELQVHFKEVIPGRGEMSYKTYLSELARIPVDAPLMLEHLKTEEEFGEARRYIQGVAKDLDLSFGA